jgi:signal peptidase I
MVDWRRRAVAAVVVAGAVLASRLTRYEIAEASMRPTLSPGDWVLAVRRPGTVVNGDVVVAEMPGRPGFEIVKRVAASAGDSLVTPDGPRIVGTDEVWLLGDDPAAGSIDSRHFGPVPRSGIRAKLVCRYRPLPITRVGSPGP